MEEVAALQRQLLVLHARQEVDMRFMHALLAGLQDFAAARAQARWAEAQATFVPDLLDAHQYDTATGQAVRAAMQERISAWTGFLRRKDRSP